MGLTPQCPLLHCHTWGAVVLSCSSCCYVDMLLDPKSYLLSPASDPPLPRLFFLGGLLLVCRSWDHLELEGLRECAREIRNQVHAIASLSQREDLTDEARKVRAGTVG